MFNYYVGFDHGSFFVPVAPWYQLSQATSGAVCLPLKPCSGACSELGSALTAILWSRALQPGDTHSRGEILGGGEGCKRHLRKANLVAIRLALPVPSETPMKKLTHSVR